MYTGCYIQSVLDFPQLAEFLGKDLLILFHHRQKRGYIL